LFELGVYFSYNKHIHAL